MSRYTRLLLLLQVIRRKHQVYYKHAQELPSLSLFHLLNASYNTTCSGELIIPTKETEEFIHPLNGILSIPLITGLPIFTKPGAEKVLLQLPFAEKAVRVTV